MRCWFRQLGPCSWRADGQPDRMHFIPAQRLRNAGLTDDQVWDPRVWRNACRGHHDAFDFGSIELSEEDFPTSVRDFAAEHGFGWFGNREGWRKLERRS